MAVANPTTYGLTSKVISRFWSKVDRQSGDGCWNWLIGRFPNGYGMFSVKPKTLYAHRIAWVLTFGEIPEGMYVCHTCDNKRCCNPAHFFLGTAADNNRDCQEKGRVSSGEKHAATVSPIRRARGERNGFSKLSDSDVVDIRELLKQGLSQQSVGNKFGVSQRTVSLISRGQAWSHVPSKT